MTQSDFQDKLLSEKKIRCSDVFTVYYLLCKRVNVKYISIFAFIFLKGRKSQNVIKMIAEISKFFQ